MSSAQFEEFLKTEIESREKEDRNVSIPIVSEDSEFKDSFYALRDVIDDRSTDGNLRAAA
jgi:hypothetical protein